MNKSLLAAAMIGCMAISSGSAIAPPAPPVPDISAQLATQEAAHDMAEAARRLGLPEDHEVIKLAKSYWHGAEARLRAAREAAPCWTEEDAALIARVIWAEGRGLPEPEQAAVAWCILNRVDESGGTIAGTAAAPGQFVIGELHEAQLAIARDVLARWEREKAGETDVGRTLPPGYLWFTGDGQHNWFRSAYQGGDVWRWES